ncbi:DUF4352 domain-containing protein [Listeria booriae]|uniref:DUF4352 domain-containing protein n=1 Tax=Listeria booriae TaxID=1552123 RepID=A0A841Y5L3_9LIST|nr:DUF4352 domain-containing protein [Listeria booriae]MBC1211342.1 DUF4352 domain-containing protein [Listeria booriae]MBC1317815.1 DUF4352 domain-containing protein [Listeria booriae]MBC1552886.1 DUF4352 domain-containing protein [Listeria booriae]
MKKIVIIFSAILVILTGCAKSHDKERFYQLHESIEAKAWEIALDQAAYTDERAQESKPTETVLRLKVTVKNIAAEELLFDTTKLKVTDSEGEELKIYPYENMIEKISPKQSLTGYSYFIASKKAPYHVTYTYPITKDTFTWEVTPEDK